MKKRSGFLIFILVFIIIVSIVGIILLPGQIFSIDPSKDFTQFLIYIPILSIVIALSFLIAHLINKSHEKKMSGMERRLSMWNSISYRVKKLEKWHLINYQLGLL